MVPSELVSVTRPVKINTLVMRVIGVPFALQQVNSTGLMFVAASGQVTKEQGVHVGFVDTPIGNGSCSVSA